MEGFQFEVLQQAWPLLMAGLKVTLGLSAAAFALALAVGIAVGVLRSESPLFKAILSPYVEAFRGTPLLIQLFFIYYGLPSVGVTLSSTTAGILGLGLNGGAYISEIIRGALFSVPSGQKEAATALGLSRLQALRCVVLPQAIRVATPPLVNAFSALLKDSSLVSVLAITELTRASQLIYTRTFRAFEVYLAVGLVYFVLIYAVSRLSRRLEQQKAFPSTA
ncbi:amino acid ABC transporter permease [Desulfoluna spongiiphila]|uniref:amino acid ABC transporter permease n=1 Tax=Desulfoluna spongiiphila TaxID=419481 RepID=UPI001254CEC4|nr:amino acid ABC transporter permease [Desulfoluna spongiiphila]VVS93035.1 amino acid abc transporter permease protein 3-tm domain [Desulfoluna spongiiphila]